MHFTMLLCAAAARLTRPTIGQGVGPIFGALILSPVLHPCTVRCTEERKTMGRSKKGSLGMPKAQKGKVAGAQPRVGVGRPPKRPAQPPVEEKNEDEDAQVVASAPSVLAEPSPSAGRTTPPPPPEPPVFAVPTLRLNAPPPPAKPPDHLSRDDVMRRARLARDYDNDACDCAEAGAPAPGDADFVEHSFLCHLHWCYAREVGCCELSFRRASNGLEYAENGWCKCFDGAFSRPGEGKWPRERCKIVTTDADGSEWPRVPPPPVGYGERRVKMCNFTTGGRMGCDCGAPGTYVPMCPFRQCVVTGKQRADRVAQVRGHSLWHDQERFGSPSLPSPPVSPGWKAHRHEYHF